MKYTYKNKHLIFIFFIFILLSLVISLGHVDRWVLSEQIAMAENFEKNGTFYPNLLHKNISGVSVYPPGIAFISFLLLKLNLNSYIFEILLLSSVGFIVLFFVIQKKLVSQFFKVEISNNELLIYIILISTLLPRWYDYSLQLKPELFAFTLGLLWLLIIKNIDKNSYVSHLVMGIIFTLPIIFKQQYLSFIAGYIFYSFFNLSKKNIFTSIGIVLSFIFSFKIFNFDNVFYWSFEVLSDDGLNSILIILSEHYLILLRLTFFICFCFLIEIKLNINKYLLKGSLIKSIKGNPLISIMFFSFIANYLSFFKNGGTGGNIETALVFLTPLFMIIFQKINLRFLILFAFIGTLSLLPKAFTSIEDYINMLNFKNSINKLEVKPNVKIVTDSNSYYASRFLLEEYDVENYFTLSLLAEKSNTPKLLNYYEENLLESEFILLIENSLSNRIFISDLDLEILYEDKSSIAAKNY